MNFKEAKQLINSLGKELHCGYVRSKTGRSVQRWIVEGDGEKTYYTKFQFEKLYGKVKVEAPQKVEDTVKHSVKLNLIAKIRKLPEYDAVSYDHLISLSPLPLKQYLPAILA